MSRMDCAQVEELLGAHALDALTEDDARQVEVHLASCADHRRVAEELKRTAALLALTVEEGQPSPELRGRILQAISVPGQPEERLPRPARLPAPVLVPIRRIPRLPRWAPRPALAGALAALVLVAVAAGALVQRAVGTSQLQSWTFKGNLVAPSAQARLVYFKDTRQTVVTVSGLPALPQGKVYALWVIKDGQPVAQGVSAAPEGRLAANLSADLSRFDSFGITVEAGEVPLPTTSPILVGKLRPGGG